MCFTFLQNNWVNGIFVDELNSELFVVGVQNFLICLKISNWYLTGKLSIYSLCRPSFAMKKTACMLLLRAVRLIDIMSTLLYSIIIYWSYENPSWTGDYAIIDLWRLVAFVRLNDLARSIRIIFAFQVTCLTLYFCFDTRCEGLDDEVLAQGSN